MNCVLFAKMDQVFSLKKTEHEKILENGKKYWKSQGILSVQRSGNPDFSKGIKYSKMLTLMLLMHFVVRSGPPEF